MTNRQWEVLRILLRDKKTTISKIANELEVHTRTIERNIERLISTGVAVTKKQGRGGGVYIHEKYKVDIELLTDRDILELFSAASIYANIFETDFLKRMNRKITLLNPESMQIVRTIIDRCLVIDLFEKPIKIDEQIELEIRKAIMLEHKIIFEEKFFKKYPHLITLAEHAEWYYTHSINVAILSVLLAKQLEYDDNTIREIVIGAILHDIGLIFIDKEILYKEDIELEVEDMELRKKHCNLGIMTMKSASIPLVSEKIIEQHHEELDGTGYPKQLKKESILKEAHIVAIADRLDTRISYKGEKKVEALQDVITDMHKMSKKYDRKSVNALKKIFNI